VRIAIVIIARENFRNSFFDWSPWRRSPTATSCPDLPLLCSYCRAVVLERRASEQLVAVVSAGKVPSPWLAIYGTAAKTTMALSARLRLGPLRRTHEVADSPSGAVRLQWCSALRAR
jgi:hypothetical protein